MSSKNAENSAKTKRNKTLKVSFSNEEFNRLLDQIGLNPKTVNSDRKHHSKHIAEYIRGILIKKKPNKINLHLEYLALLASEVSNLKHFLESNHNGDLTHFFEKIDRSLAQIRFNKKGDNSK